MEQHEKMHETLFHPTVRRPGTDEQLFNLQGSQRTSAGQMDI